MEYVRYNNKYNKYTSIIRHHVPITTYTKPTSPPKSDEHYSINKNNEIPLSEIRNEDNAYQPNNYENFPIDESKIYNNIPEFLQNVDIANKDNCIIYLLNWGCGMGSTLSVFAQNSYYLRSINPKIHVIPSFCKNTITFKYHDVSLNNSFFKYFKYLRDTDEIISPEIYFVRSLRMDGVIFFEREQPPLEQVNSKILISHFRENFQLRIGNKVRNLISEIKDENKRPMIGLHIRSYFHNPDNGVPITDTFENTFNTLKKSFDIKYGQYDIFVATDVTEYNVNIRNIFKSVYSLGDIDRIENGQCDSIPLLKNVGFKLGSDIIYDCAALSSCDFVYITMSNIPIIVSMINADTNMIEYHY